MAQPRRRTDLLATSDLRALLEELTDRLADKHVTARIYLLGGAAMALAYYDDGERQLTNDVDASFGSLDAVAHEALAMAEEKGLRPTWLNDKVRQFVPPDGLPKGATLIARDGVSVVVAPARLLLAMKLRAARIGRDDEDIAILIRRCDIRSVEEAQQVLDECYGGEEPFTLKAEAIVVAALDRYEVTSADPPFTLDKVAPR